MNYTNNNIYNDSDDLDKKSPVIKIIGIIILIAIAIFLFFFVLKSCNSGSKIEKELLDAGKKHYSNTTLLPTATGECSTVTAESLIDEGSITNFDDFASCNKTETYVKVCKLASGKYHYTPILLCDKITTNFGEWMSGNESNLTADKSDVKFLFNGEIYNGKMNLYYPLNKSNANEVKEYYVSTPADGYINTDSETTAAAKWYTNKIVNSYWNNGTYSSTKPGDYIKGAEGSKIITYSLTSPATADYRTITAVSLYRTAKAPSIYKYVCSDSVKYGTITSDTKCDERDSTNFKIIKEIQYTCDGTNKVTSNTACSTWSELTETKCTASNTTLCEKSNGYKSSDQTWKWYKKVTVRSYYPSGSATAAGEKTYYITAPVSGAIKDDTTISTAHKYYMQKQISIGTSVATNDWKSVTNGFVDKESLFTAYKTSGYNIKSLKEIEDSSELRYTIKLQYRERK